MLQNDMAYISANWQLNTKKIMNQLMLLQRDTRLILKMEIKLSDNREQRPLKETLQRDIPLKLKMERKTSNYRLQRSKTYLPKKDIEVLLNPFHAVDEPFTSTVLPLHCSGCEQKFGDNV